MINKVPLSFRSTTTYEHFYVEIKDTQPLFNSQVPCDKTNTLVSTIRSFVFVSVHFLTNQEQNLVCSRYFVAVDAWL